MGYKTILLEKFWVKSSIKDRRKVKGVMNDLTGMKIA